MVYKSGQVKVMFPYIHSGISQFILGGPCDGDEAQVFHRRYPRVLITGFEPNKSFYQYQNESPFPGNLRKEALWSSIGEVPFTPYIETNVKTLDEASRQEIRGNRVVESSSNRVPTITLDSVFFPALKNSIALWIDIERSELMALQGAKKLLNSGAISVIVLEAMGDTINEIQPLLNSYHYQEVEFYNSHDYIFCLFSITQVKVINDNS